MVDVIKTIIFISGIITAQVAITFCVVCFATRYLGKEKNSTKQRKYITFTKRWFNRILESSIVWVYLSYALAFMGKEQIAETLSVAAITTILGAFITYCIKSFGEKKINKEKEENEEDNSEIHE